MKRTSKRSRVEEITLSSDDEEPMEVDKDNYEANLKREKKKFKRARESTKEAVEEGDRLRNSSFDEAQKMREALRHPLYEYIQGHF